MPRMGRVEAMPFVLFIAYTLLETLAFWAVAKWIGILWALVALFVSMFFGMSLAGIEIRRIMSRQIVRGQDGIYYMDGNQAGKTAGNVGLTLAGGMLLSMPGFVSTLIGALLIFAPTRSLARTILAASMVRKIEHMGTRIFEASPMAQHHDSYGSFGNAADYGSTTGYPGGAQGSRQEPEVLDEEEIRQWTENLDPDDFTSGSSDDSGNDAGDSKK
ncbi:exlusion protein FxsA [Corynebacterium striatum]|nr:exclusion protein FxsA [Corynebacterium striatum]PIS60199.1 exlusion protein FxsA [Corynebacterium striatum]PIS60685.1 exlusion protein FxsA [Corynebacterium striatum]PIS65511.1 exlusion protein FxsA [Corynebacterium striatum]PXY07618.1 exlusion protein FxsA [Corynebacterium striatum]